MKPETYKAKTHYQQGAVAKTYDEERFSTWHGRIAHKMESEAVSSVMHRHFKPGGAVLDLPCGTGRLLDVYHEGNYVVTGGDISDEMLAVAQQKYANDARFSFCKCDGEKLPFSDGEFDYLVSFRLMGHLPEAVRQKVLSEMVRVTRKALIVNYHFAVNSPLMLFNKVFRPQAAYLPYPLRESDLRNEAAVCRNAEIVEVRKLSWFERSSALVVFRKL